MRKARKGKKMLTILLIAIVAIIILVVAIVLIVRKVNEGKAPEEPQETVVALPDTTYNSMEVTNVSMEYLDSQDQTMVSMSILNTTQNNVENESLNAMLVDGDGKVIGQMQTWIQSLAPNEEYDISVILNGNLTSTQAIKLEKVESQSSTEQPAQNTTSTQNTTAE